MVLARILEQRGENPDIAQYFRGFGLREGAQPVERDLGFWIEVLEREGKLPEGQYEAADLLLLPIGASRRTEAGMALANTVARGEVTIRDLTKSFHINGRRLAVLQGPQPPHPVRASAWSSSAPADRARPRCCGCWPGWRRPTAATS